MAHDYDVVVAGAGMAGIGAAVSAARLGARTLLVERYGFLGGLATAGLVNPFMSYYTSNGIPLVGGVFAELCDRMQSMDGMLDRAFNPELFKYVSQEMVIESGVELLLHARVLGVHMEEGRLAGLNMLMRTGEESVSGGITIDTTGDADLAYMAGVPYEFGNPEHGMAQAMTLMFTIGGVDVRKALLYAKDHPDEMRFPKPASDSEIDEMLSGAVGVAGYYGLIDTARSKGDFTLPQDMVFFITLPTPSFVVVNTTHVSGLDATNSWDLTKAEIEGRRQAIEVMRFLRGYVPGFEKAYLAQTAAQIGVRESRRIKGEYIFDGEDVVAGRKFDDAVLRSAYPVDIHSSTGKGYARAEDGARPVGPPDGDWYEVPYRSLVPLGVDNLLVAGRCISASHVGQSAVRIMPNCMALGQAAGTAAAMCVKGGITPREIDGTQVMKELLATRAIL